MDAEGAPKVACYSDSQVTCTFIYARRGSESTVVSNYYIRISRKRYWHS